MAEQRQNQRVAEVVGRLKSEIKQLQAEVNVPRQAISVSSHQLVQFILEQQQFDPLVSGPARARNPYKIKSSCSIIWKVIVKYMKMMRKLI